MPSSDNKFESTGEVQSVRRALSILDVLAGRKKGLKLKVLAELAELPPSTAHRLLTTLQNHHYVRFEPEQNLWLLGRKVLEHAKSLCTPAPGRKVSNGCGAA